MVNTWLIYIVALYCDGSFFHVSNLWKYSILFLRRSFTNGVALRQSPSRQFCSPNLLPRRKVLILYGVSCSGFDPVHSVSVNYTSSHKNRVWVHNRGRAGPYTLLPDWKRPFSSSTSPLAQKQWRWGLISRIVVGKEKWFAWMGRVYSPTKAWRAFIIDFAPNSHSMFYYYFFRARFVWRPFVITKRQSSPDGIQSPKMIRYAFFGRVYRNGKLVFIRAIWDGVSNVGRLNSFVCTFWSNNSYLFICFTRYDTFITLWNCNTLKSCF